MVRHSVELVEPGDENAMTVDKEEKVAPAEGSDGEGSGEEEEYEIEEILDAKRGAFPDGRMGYLVKWKNYGEDENSWVDEHDTENAKDLVNEYWRKHPKKKPRKSLDPKPAKRARKSTVPESDSDANSTAKKRGRKSTATKPESGSDSDDNVSTSRAKKPARKAPERMFKKTEEPPAPIQDMSKYMDKDSWETLIDTVDTVERTDKGLFVYFTLKSGEQIMENNKLCRTRFPQKLLSFYESNLKWRAAENGDE